MTDDDIFELAYESTELEIRFGTLDFAYYKTLRDKLVVIQENNYNNYNLSQEDKDNFNRAVDNLGKCLDYLKSKKHDFGFGYQYLKLPQVQILDIIIK